MKQFRVFTSLINFDKNCFIFSEKLEMFSASPYSDDNRCFVVKVLMGDKNCFLNVCHFMSYFEASAMNIFQILPFLDSK